MCVFKENRVVIHDLETEDQKEIEIQEPQYCASSQHYLAVTTSQRGLHLYTTDGVLVQIIPYSTYASCAAFHPRYTNILAIGYTNGTLRMWDISTRVYLSTFKEHTYRVTHIRFASDGRLFLSSRDESVLIIKLDDQFQLLSSIKLEGHTAWVTDIIPLPISNQCITCSEDTTLKVWDSETGVCLRTLNEHTDLVMSLAMHPNGQHFASGSDDQSVIIWSSETFEVLLRLQFALFVQAVIFDEVDTLYAGVVAHGVMSCKTLTGTGEVGPVIIPATGSCDSISLGKTRALTSSTIRTTHSHS